MRTSFTESVYFRNEVTTIEQVKTENWSPSGYLDHDPVRDEGVTPENGYNLGYKWDLGVDGGPEPNRRNRTLSCRVQDSILVLPWDLESYSNN